MGGAHKKVGESLTQNLYTEKTHMHRQCLHFTGGGQPLGTGVNWLSDAVCLSLTE